MRPFCYARPSDLSEALSLLAEHGPDARLLAGGTDVLVRLRLGHMRPGIVVDVKHIGELRADIVETDGCLRIGARAVMTDIIADLRIRRHFPALVEAAAVVGSVQIRNRATLAGQHLQRIACRRYGARAAGARGHGQSDRLIRAAPRAAA